MEKIKNNKNKVCEQLEDLVEELRNGSYKNFRIDIEKEKNELDKLDSLKNEEKDLNKAIRKINSEYKKAEEEFENEVIFLPSTKHKFLKHFSRKKKTTKK